MPVADSSTPLNKNAANQTSASANQTNNVAQEQSRNNASEQPQDLLNVLVQNKIISASQAQLVRTDIEVTGMLTEDILLARRWVKPETLFQLAPWLKLEKTSHSPRDGDPREYKENLKRYRQLTNEILGEQREE